MSTYLVACVVSEFTFRPARSIIRSTNDTTTLNVTDIRIWARADAINQAELAVAVTPIMLEFLENYFQVPFPLPKVDLIGLPDFSSGAMENWGLITYRFSVRYEAIFLESIQNDYFFVLGKPLYW